MKPDDSIDGFLRYVEQRAGVEVADLTPSRGAELFLGFFRDVASDCGRSNGTGDILLLHWGLRDWEDGERFDIELARQFVVPGGQEAQVSQLSLTFSFVPEAKPRSLGPGELRCRGRDEAESFAEGLSSCVALAAVPRVRGRPNKAMKLTSLSAAPGLSCTTGVDGGAASCPRRLGAAGTGSQLIASVRRSLAAAEAKRGRGDEGQEVRETRSHARRQ